MSSVNLFAVQKIEINWKKFLLLLLLLKPKTKRKKEAKNNGRESLSDKKSSKPEDLRLQEIYNEQ